MRRKIMIICGFILLGCCICGFIFRKDIINFVSSVSSHFSEYNDVLFVDFEKMTGEIKPLNGINNGPKNGYSGDSEEDSWQLDATQMYKDLVIPIVRTHDSEYTYGQDKFIDIHCIFPDFSKNVEDPGSYNFSYTDKYIEAIIETGAEVFFRLGESIDHSGDNLYINPPADYMKWAQICEHIIRHYNEGWASGYEYDIKYWEIWNEPDNDLMWTGTMEEYTELYKTTASYLKKIYPDIYIGGYAAAECDEDIISGFLQSLSSDRENVPLDFFSWHTYTSDPVSYRENAALVREILDENGFENTISILDEWNYVKNWEDLDGITEMVRSVKGASFIAASMITMQNSKVDMAMYYDGQFAYDDFAWCGLYSADTEKLPGYYVFDFFETLYRQKKQVYLSKSETLDNIYGLAVSGEKNCILLTNYKDEENITSVFRLSFTGDRNNAIITRINEKSHERKTTKQKAFFNELVISLKSGETVFIELE